MAKKWILTADIPDMLSGEPTSQALIHDQEDLDQRLKDAEACGVKTSVREVK